MTNAEENAAPPVTERLLAVARPAQSRNLIVSFNSYGAGQRPGQRPDRPFGIFLENFRPTTAYDAHVLWFAEAAASWYVEHQYEILSKITDYVLRHDIAAIKLVGASAGGYAALRYGLLLDQWLTRRNWTGSILAFPVNPQTGFRTDLINRIKLAEITSRWKKGRVGVNPIIMAPDLQELYADIAIDIVELASLCAPRDFGAAIVYDGLNPIEQVFCGDLAALDYILPMPRPLRLEHHRACGAILTEHLWPIFDAVLPFGKLDGESAELISLTD